MAATAIPVSGLVGIVDRDEHVCHAIEIGDLDAKLHLVRLGVFQEHGSASLEEDDFGVFELSQEFALQVSVWFEE